MKNTFKLPQEVFKLPETYGVYQFLNSKHQPIYIGKSINLKKRIINHLQNPFDAKTKKFVSESKSIRILPTTNEFDAIILEVRLIQKYQPTYNTLLKDDKSPAYIVITEDEFPIVKIVRAHSKSARNKNWRYFGPFLKAKEAVFLMRYIRQIIPFSTHKPQKKACVYKELGLCNPCPSDRSNQNIYTRNIKQIIKILQGTTKLSSLIDQDIKKATKNLDFEKAQRLLDLKIIISSQTQTSRELWDFDNFSWQKKEQDVLTYALKDFFPKIKPIHVECFDASHHWGKFLYVGMVVFNQGLAQKSRYRLFKIKIQQNDDPEALKEAIVRRLRHLNDWGKPDLIVVDGGWPQLSLVYPLLAKRGIPVIGLAKKEELLHIPAKNVTLKPAGALLAFVTRVRDEAHRFTITTSRRAFRKGNQINHEKNH